MIVSNFSPRHGHCSFTIESPDDLWTLRRLIAKGDVVVTKSSRVVKKEDEYSRPDKGERVKVMIALLVSEVHLDSSIERMRLKGEIIEASDETVTKAGSHSVSLTPGHALTLRKKEWGPLHIHLVEAARGGAARFLLVAIDRREAGIGRLAGSHLSVLATIESGVGGKMSDEQSSSPFYSKVQEVVKQEARQGDTVVIAGPGHTKNVLYNQVSKGLSGASVRLLEGFDLAGSDGVRAMVKFPGFQSLASGSALVEMENVIREAVKRISMGDGKVAYTLSRVREAATVGAVEACVVSDDVFSTGVDEDLVVDTLNTIEARRGKVFLADSSLEVGKQVSSFGGMLALLRYQLKAY